jgi:excisionase family DNA binding protein
MSGVDQSSLWVSLSEAARILGVHPATVRSWADRGDIASQRTPGGHRRFRRDDLLRWASIHSPAPTAEAQILVQSALGRARVQILEGQLATAEWYTRLDKPAREAMSVYGRRLMESLQLHLTTANGALSAAHAIGLDYGKMIRAQGLTLKQTVEGFYIFCDFVFESLMQMAELSRPDGNHRETTWKIYTFTREVISALIEAYE